MGKVIVGIDYGSKTSVFLVPPSFMMAVFHAPSDQNKDADKWLKELLEPLKPNVIGIDAPLSIPGALREIDGFTNYHYRIADLEAKAIVQCSWVANCTSHRIGSLAKTNHSQ